MGVEFDRDPRTEEQKLADNNIRAVIEKKQLQPTEAKEQSEAIQRAREKKFRVRLNKILEQNLTLAQALSFLPLQICRRDTRGSIIMSHQTPQEAAKELTEWFGKACQTVLRAIPALAPTAEHQNAAISSLLSRHARQLSEGGLTPDQVYSSLVFYLGAACWRLKLTLSEQNWLAAINNVKSLKEQLAENTETFDVGIELGSTATLFRQQFEEALINSGVSGMPSMLDQDNQKLALGLSINWGMRFLLAYAAEQKLTPSDSRQNLAWISSLVSPLL
jgi:hypothetical protein